MNFITFFIILLTSLACVTKPDGTDQSALKIYGGQKAKVGKLEYVLDIGTCTGSPIGPSLILTAAHCSNTLSKKGFTLKGKFLRWQCHKHPRYNSKTKLNDYALCVMASPLKGVPIVSVDTIKPLQLNEEILISGYGRPNSGKLYWGLTTVDSFNGQDVYLDQKVHLGSGDSGGSAFRSGSRHVIGVQSRIFIKSKRSILNRTRDHEFRWFLSDIALKHKIIICGFTRKC